MIAETVCSAVAAAGLGIAVVTAYRKRYLTAARIAAYALVPLGLVMTGVVEWLADTAFSPIAWAGFGVLGLSWLMFATTRAVERRRGGTRKERKAAREAAAPAATSPGASAPALGQSTRAQSPAPRQKPAAQGTTTSATSRPSSRSTESDRSDHALTVGPRFPCARMFSLGVDRVRPVRCVIIAARCWTRHRAMPRRSRTSRADASSPYPSHR